MEIQHILDELENIKPGYFPREALEAAISKKEEITPHLLDVLVKIRKSLPEYFDQPDYMLHMYAFYLLAQFREVAAYPLIIDFFSLPGEMPADFVDDFLTEDLHRVLAAVYNGDPQLLLAMIARSDVYEFTRSAGIEVFLMLFATGQISREAVVGYYKGLYNGGMERQANAAWDGLVECSSLIYPDDLITDIRQAYADGLIDDLFWGPLSEREAVLQESMDDVLNKWTTSKRFTLIKDTVSELQDWTCFTDEPVTDEYTENLLVDFLLSKIANQSRSTKMSRNAPCSCGSGKKYKKCCGKNI